MLDRLLDFLLQMWERITFFYVIDEYQEGVLLRFGKFKKLLSGGFHWKIPFADNIIEQHIVTTTISLPAQSLVTSDDKAIVVEAIVKYKISDTRKYIMEIFDAVDGISDITQSTIKKLITSKTWEECKNNEIDDIITKKARAEVRKYGIDIEQVTLVSISPIRSLRLIGEAKLN